MTHIIINTPSVYSAKLPSKGWINLAQIRQIIVNDDYSRAFITWSNGDQVVFDNEDAKALVNAWNEAESLMQARGARHLQTNRRIK